MIFYYYLKKKYLNKTYLQTEKSSNCIYYQLNTGTKDQGNRYTLFLGEIPHDCDRLNIEFIYAEVSKISLTDNSVSFIKGGAKY